MAWADIPLHSGWTSPLDEPNRAQWELQADGRVHLRGQLEANLLSPPDGSVIVGDPSGLLPGELAPDMLTKLWMPATDPGSSVGSSVYGMMTNLVPRYDDPAVLLGTVMIDGYCGMRDGTVIHGAPLGSSFTLDDVSWRPAMRGDYLSDHTLGDGGWTDLLGWNWEDAGEWPYDYQEEILKAEPWMYATTWPCRYYIGFDGVGGRCYLDGSPDTWSFEALPGEWDARTHHIRSTSFPEPTGYPLPPECWPDETHELVVGVDYENCAGPAFYPPPGFPPPFGLPWASAEEAQHYNQDVAPVAVKVTITGRDDPLPGRLINIQTLEARNGVNEWADGIAGDESVILTGVSWPVPLPFFMVT